MNAIPKACTILGMGGSALGEVKTLGEVWSLNDAYAMFQVDGKPIAFDLYFELHDPLYARNFKSPRSPDADHFLEIAALGCPVMMRERQPDIMTSKTFPASELIHAIGTDFIRGSPAWMLAYAIWQGYTDIRIFGIDQMDEGHKYQRESWVHLIGMGLGRGIRFTGYFPFMDSKEQDTGLIGWIEQIKQENQNG